MAGQETLFPQTTLFAQAVEVCNNVTAKRLPIVLNRIVLNSIAGKGGKAFTPEQEAQLMEKLQLSERQLRSILEGSAFVFETAAYNTLKPERLSQELQAVSMAEAQADAFANVWRENG